MQAAAVGASTVCLGIAVVIALRVISRAARELHAAPAVLASGLALVLQFLTAAGLLRLTTHPKPTVLLLTAFTVVVRKLLAFGLRAGRQPLATE